MTGTSPAAFNNQSPSYHSSSYLPKLEANFMKDFACCGLTLASLHDLLQHFEEVHAGAPPSRTSQGGQVGLPPTNGSVNGGITPGQTQSQGEPATHTQLGFHPRSGSVGGFRPQRLGSDGFSRTNLSTVQDMDTMDGMEMDDINDGLATIDEASNGFGQPSQFSQNQSQLQPLNVNMANNMQNHQGLRTSTPTTPSASQQFNLPNNPTVSSVNTPTLGTAPMPNHNLTSPESSHPSTPAELDMDFMNTFNQPMMGVPGMDMGFGNTGFNTGMPGFDGTIDQPGKRLFSKQGSGLSQQQLQAAFKNYQMGNGDQTDLAKRLREQALMNGANVPQFPFPEEVKPFRCPVIGCEKAYKNQNGLKYHKQVSSPSRRLFNTYANQVPARSPESAAQGERGRYLFDRRPAYFDTLPWHRWYGEGEALPMRDVRQALQESQRSQIPPRTFAQVQPRAIGRTVQPAACVARAERRCQCRRRWYDGNGHFDVLVPGQRVERLLQHTYRPSRLPSSLIPHGRISTSAWRSFVIDLDG